MKYHKSIKNKKRAISELIAYVLLISLAISLSSVVFLWLKFYVQQGTVQTCPDGVSVIIKDYSCSQGAFTNTLNLTIQNKGLFTINGTVVFYETSFSNNENTLPTNRWESPNMLLNPSNYSAFSISYTGHVYKIAVLPFRIEKGKKVFCDKAVIMQKTSSESNCI